MSDNLLINKYPDIAKEWNYQKNIGIDINNITYGSRLIVWWKCEKTHEWKCEILKRTYAQRVCNKCKIITNTKYNSFGANYPNLLKFWNYNKNIDIDFNSISQYSRININWICENNHEWKLGLNIMIKKQQCMKCEKIQNHENIKKENKKSLLNKYPEISKEWDYQKNGDLNPKNVTYSSHKVVWWICSNNHSWQSIINKRTLRNKICIQCKIDIIDKKLLQFELETIQKQNNKFMMSFGIKYPHLTRNWNYIKNNYTPFDVSSKSHIKIWMKCPKNHEWLLRTFELVQNGNCNCKECYLITNNLAIKFPNITKEFNMLKNNIDPSKITYGSDLKVWWKCIQDHEWYAKISRRTVGGNNCPLCNTYGYSKKSIDWLNEISKSQKINISHAENGGEYKINYDNKILKVDGYCKKTNTIYEFLGCYWHFHYYNTCQFTKNKKLFEKNKNNKKLNIDLYIETINRLALLKKLNYQVVYIWECEYANTKRYNVF